MGRQYRNILDSFTAADIPNLDMVVLGALELFSDTKPPILDLSEHKHPLVIGSGNAEVTGRIIFANKNAIFASESTYQEMLINIPEIDSVVLISASGGKHAPIIAENAKRYNKNVLLITNTHNSQAHEKLELQSGDNEFIFPKNREPYTYNTSTYMGMILGETKESPADILRFIEEQLQAIELPDFSKYNKYFLIVPPQFSNICRMLNVKFIELFGRRIAHDVETSEYINHATTVVPSDELFISFGEENNTWGDPENRLTIPLPHNANYASMMAVGYYIVGQIQKAHPPYFKNNIEDYCKKISEIFGQEINPIVNN